MKRFRSIIGGLALASCALTGTAFAKPTRVRAPAADFTLVTVGDLIISRPLSMLRNAGASPDPKGVGDALDLLKLGDVTYGNMETSIFDYRTFAGYPFSWEGDWMLTASPAVVPELQGLGFDILSRANNHALDWGPEGMRQTIALLGDKFASAGTGENLEDATKAAYFESPKGKVGIVSMVSTYRPTTDALTAGEYARPGVNPLTVTPTSLVDNASYAAVVAIACSFTGGCPDKDKPLPPVVDLFGTAVAASSDAPYTYTYVIDDEDLKRNGAAVEKAKKEDQARYVLATIHAHESISEEDPPTSWQDPAAFLETLAKAMIDKGADAFIVTGIHHVAGIDIYKGKPIFYGLGNFFWSDMQEPLASDLYDSIGNQKLLADSFEHPERATDADLSNVLNANSVFATKGDVSENRTFQTVLAHTSYDNNGNATEIRLYPIDLGYGEKLTQSGVPRQASKNGIAEKVLERIIALSAGGNVMITTERENGYLIGVAKLKPSR